MKRSCIFLPEKQIPCQQLKVSVSIFCKTYSYKFSNRITVWPYLEHWHRQLKQNWLASHSKIWLKIVFRSNVVLTRMELFFNNLKEKKTCTCHHKINTVPFSKLKRRGQVFNFMHFPSKWFFWSKARWSLMFKESYTTQFHSLKTLIQRFFRDTQCLI